MLAPSILIEELAPLLRNAAPSRVINVTSGGQYDQKIPRGDIESDRATYGPKRIYARTKREELVLTEQWAQRLAGTGVHVHAMHPGWADTAGVRNWMPVFRALTRPIIRTPEQGVDTIVWLGRALFRGRARPVPQLAGPGAGPASTSRLISASVPAMPRSMSPEPARSVCRNTVTEAVAWSPVTSR